jgi:predicted 3-demethylubiquinone-9 3-methyltransferase (glyoxalase superfamily)
MKLQNIQPCLWVDGNAEKAVKFYNGIFPKTRTGTMVRVTPEVGEVHGAKAGTVLTVELELLGQRFLVLAGRPPAILPSYACSFIIHCKDQKEVDHYWKKLGAGGPKEMQNCGWLQDKFGVVWQVVPERFMKMVADKDARKVDRVMKAMMPMKKLDLAQLEKAFKG